MKHRSRWLSTFLISLAITPVGTSASAHGSEPEILVSQAAFTPPDVQIEVGETVTWRVEEDGHSVTSRDKLFDFDVEKGDERRFTFKREGTYRYFCKLHASMKGVITVGDGCAGHCEPCADCERLTRRVPSAAYPTMKGALLGAPAGTLIEVEPGRYNIGAPLVIDKRGITIRGVKRNGRPAPPGAVVLRGKNGAPVGVKIAVRSKSRDTAGIENLTLTGFLEAGLVIEDAGDYLVKNVRTVANGEDGIRIERSSWGTLDRVTSVGHRNAGISITDCAECALKITDSVVRANFQGFEAIDAHSVAIQNSRFVKNANGVALRSTEVALSHGPGGIRLFDNLIATNGHPDAPVPSLSEFTRERFPAGAGVWIHGRTGDIVLNNTIAGNNYGVVVTGGPQWTQHHRVLENRLERNAVDLAWDGIGEDVCFRENAHATSEPAVIEDLYPCDRSVTQGLAHPKIEADLVTFAWATYYCRQTGGQTCP